MNKQIPYSIVMMFIATTLLTLVLFLNAFRKGEFTNPSRAAKILMWTLFPWMCLQAAWGFSGFYRQYSEIPPTIFLYGIGPSFAAILLLLTVKKWRDEMLKLDLEALTWFHVVRLPVELILVFLCYYKSVPTDMTIEGRNFDLLSGISAPLIAWLVFKKKKGGKKLLVAWNLICIGLLINIIAVAVLSAPLPFQKFGLDQPNTAVFFFPFVWLPTMIVPLVMLAHLVSLIKLLKREN